MADILKLAPIIKKWEGGFVEDKDDKGGATNEGITLVTWRILGHDENEDGVVDKTDLKLITDNDFILVLRNYWNRWRGDDIINQSLANILVDWVWGSGVWGIKRPQKILGFKKPDGIVGSETLGRLNASDPKVLFDTIKQDRLDYVQELVDADASQTKFLRGWKNRINDFTYDGQTNNNGNAS